MTPGPSYGTTRCWTTDFARLLEAARGEALRLIRAVEAGMSENGGGSVAVVADAR